MTKIGLINIAIETFGGIFSLVIVLCLILGGRQDRQLRWLYIRVLLCNTLLIFCDSAAWIFKGNMNTISWYVVRISNFLVYILGYVLSAMFTDYLVYLVQSKKELKSSLLRISVWAISSVGILLVIVSLFYDIYYVIDEFNYYHRQDGFWFSQLLGIVILLLNAGYLIRHRRYLSKREAVSLAIYIIMPVIALLVQIIFYGVAVLNLANIISLLCIYISIQADQSRLLGEKELELSKSKTACLASQIRPHFLYNSLLAIQQLCMENPKRAQEAVGLFAGFLRSNISSLSSEECIPFHNELEHVKAYLCLEQIRFEARLQVEYQIEAENFCIPALTLQPIVENAVRYGITSRPMGGTVIITTKEEQMDYVVTVQDDGEGFDPSESLEDGKEHIGLENVRNRLKILCGGSLTVFSEKKKGTIVTILLPKR